MTKVSPFRIGHPVNSSLRWNLTEVEFLGKDNSLQEGLAISRQSTTYSVEVESCLVIIGLLPERHCDNGLDHLDRADGLGECPHEMIAGEDDNVLVDLVLRQRLRRVSNLVNVSGTNAHWR